MKVQVPKSKVRHTTPRKKANQGLPDRQNHTQNKDSLVRIKRKIREFLNAI